MIFFFFASAIDLWLDLRSKNILINFFFFKKNRFTCLSSFCFVFFLFMSFMGVFIFFFVYLFILAFCLWSYFELLVWWIHRSGVIDRNRSIIYGYGHTVVEVAAETSIGLAVRSPPSIVVKFSVYFLFCPSPLFLFAFFCSLSLSLLCLLLSSMRLASQVKGLLANWS